MRSSITLGLLLGVTLSVAPLGCRESDPAGPQPLDNVAGSGAGDDKQSGSDSSSTSPAPPNVHEPADPAGPAGADTAVYTPPPLAASFTLRGVALGAVARADTTHTVVLPGATARLVRVKRADGSDEPDALTGSTVADVNGRFVFENVASAYYRVDVTPPAGAPYLDASSTIAPPWSSEIRVYVVLLPKDR